MDRTKLTERLLVLVADEVKWNRLEDYLEFIESDYVESLKTSRDIREINKLQGKLELLTTLLTLPEQIRSLT